MEFRQICNKHENKMDHMFNWKFYLVLCCIFCSGLAKLYNKKNMSGILNIISV